jgi:DNA-binding beta-propeller fold protein YncE
MVSSKLICGSSVVLLLACGSSGAAPSGRDDGFGFGGGSSTASGGSAVVIPNTMGGGGNNGVGGRPPEVENESAYLAPVVTGKYLWSANPLSGRVALIDAETLSVKLQIAGNRPTTVLGISEGEQYGALVLNDISNDATLLRVDDQGELRRVKSFATQPDANAWSASPSAHWAIAWTDAAQKTGIGPLDLFQDITLFSLDLNRETAFRLSVGSRPSRFVFDAAEEHAYAVTEEGISVIELGAPPSVTGVIPVSNSSLAERSSADIGFAPDGSYAVVRSQNSSRIATLSLPGGVREELDLGGVVTDLDLVSDGSRAYAVLGGQAQVVEVPIPIAGREAASLRRVELTGEAIGAIALNTDASAALVYSTVTGSTRVAVLDLVRPGSTFSYRVQDLISPVTALFAAPDPRFAISFQAAPTGSKRVGAFSLLSMQAQRVPKIVGTDAAPLQVAFSPQGSSALVTVRTDSKSSFGAYLVALENQQVDFVPLQSPPLAAGVIPLAGRAYIAQAHPEGRITFVSLADSQLQTLTGFELAARIVQ